MVPLAASPAYGIMYRTTIETFPGAFLIFTAGLYVLVAILLVIVTLGLRGVEKRKQKSSEDETKLEKLLSSDEVKI